MISGEKWQIDVGGQIYEAEFDELEQWVYEGSLLPGDLVRRGSLRWIEAGKVPPLVKFFNAREKGDFPPPVVTTTNSASMETSQFTPAQNFSEISENHFDCQPETNKFNEIPGSENEAAIRPNENAPNLDAVNSAASDVCCFHPEYPSFYVCETCANYFCKTCPKSYGGAVKICPCCGAMCKTVKESETNLRQTARLQTDLNEGFGFADFAKALTYPFKFKASLIFGALFFAFFSFGQIAASFGGVMMFAALICYFGTNMLSFGILANTLDNFSQGKTDSDFLPKFETFSIWEDVVHPFFLSIGVYLVSFGLFAVILIGGLWYFFSAVTGANNQELMQKAAQINAAKQQSITQKAAQNEPLTAESVEKSHADENAKVQSLMQDLQKEETAAPETENSSNVQFDAQFKNFSGLTMPFIVCLAAALLWGIFYFPAACAVAGYTRSFVATLNIFIGFDTIKRLGIDYLKILLMTFALSLILGFAVAMLGKILKPFDLPMIGNIPLKIISGVFTFYFSTVFACILGYALYKNSHKLKLFK